MPHRLFIAADGPRVEKQESSVCDKVREFVLSSINWPCEILTLFQEKNLGCKYAVSGAIKWFFENVESGIILEDDCLPSSSFFDYCETLLRVYEDDVRVGMISGHNYFGRTSTRIDYSFITTCGVWGWASWRRALNGYNPDSSVLLEPDLGPVDTICFSKRAEEVILKNALLAARNEIDTWDYQLCEHFMVKKMLTVMPSVNLVRNIGFSADSTHTPIIPKWYLDKSYEYGHAVRISKRVKADKALSRKVESLFVAREGFSEMAKRLVKKFL